MKKLKFLCSAFVVASLLAIPATAQRHGMGRMGQMSQMGHHNNKPRAEKDNDDKGKQNPDRDKGKGKAKGETQGKHKGHLEH